MRAVSSYFQGEHVQQFRIHSRHVRGDAVRGLRRRRHARGAGSGHRDEGGQSQGRRRQGNAGQARGAEFRSTGTQADLVDLSDRIWAYAETALRETRSAAALADYAEQQGFKVERGVAGMPTAFVATYGSGRPVIGIMGEYDALPGISQKASPVQEPLQAGAAGHGCGHNLFGAASLGAAIAIKEQIAAGKLKGTVRFYGTPAEEAVGGKVYMAREGLFDGVDAVLAWHPSDETQADMTSSQAMVSLIVEFEGRTAHAARRPMEWPQRGRRGGAVHARHQHDARARQADFAHALRDPVRRRRAERRAGVCARSRCGCATGSATKSRHLLARTRKVAEGAATMTETTGKVTVEGGSWEMLVNETGERLLHANLLLARPGRRTRTKSRRSRSRSSRRRACRRSACSTGVKPLEGQEEEGGSTDVARHQLGRADAARLGRHGAGRRALARLAGGRDGRHVDRPQGHGAGLEGARGHDGRPLRATAGPCGGAG